MSDERLLKSEERAMYSLRALYNNYGYLPYKMNKFEEYDLYVRNKAFLVSDKVITFNDTDGSLMALKPDVTLSIIKNGNDDAGKQKVCYNENVYRVSESSGRFRELMQSGLECIGDIDTYDIFENIYLAAKSLSLISDSFVLVVSHLGIISTILEEACSDGEFLIGALSCISQKNSHDLKKLCASFGLDEINTEKVISLVTVYGDRNTVIEKMKPLCTGKAAEALEQLAEISALIDDDEWKGKIYYDFSVVSDRRYYDGVVFRGFIDGVSADVLSGGQYNALMRKFGRKSGAVGFAIYLDMLERLQESDHHSDVDVLLLYDDATDKKLLADEVKRLASGGASVSAQKSIPQKLSYDGIVDLRGGKSC